MEPAPARGPSEPLRRQGGPFETVAAIGGIALLLVLAPLFEETFFHRFWWHDLVWLVYAVPTAIAAYAFGFRGAVSLGLLETAIVWIKDFNVQEFRATGEVEIVVLFLTAYNLVIALSMGLLTERLRHQRDLILKANSQLEDMASRDHVTGLFNSRAFHRGLQEALEAASRGSGSVGLVFIDVDKFRAFNDRHGHQVGDAVLARVGCCIQGAVRTGDLPCRYGGDEFAVILPGAGIAEARKVADRIREAVLAMRTAWGDITLSFGVAAYPDHAHDATSLMSAADEALYAAKHFGRNQVAVAGQ